MDGHPPLRGTNEEMSVASGQLLYSAGDGLVPLATWRAVFTARAHVRGIFKESP
jgi:hypothetical protein